MMRYLIETDATLKCRESRAVLCNHQQSTSDSQAIQFPIKVDSKVNITAIGICKYHLQGFVTQNERYRLNTYKTGLTNSISLLKKGNIRWKNSVENFQRITWKNRIYQNAPSEPSTVCQFLNEKQTLDEYSHGFTFMLSLGILHTDDFNYHMKNVFELLHEHEWECP